MYNYKLFEVYNNILDKKLDKISQKIKSAEAILKKMPFENFEPLQMDLDFFLVMQKKRLMFFEKGKEPKPLIEQKVAVRVNAAPFIDLYMDRVIEGFKFFVESL